MLFGRKKSAQGVDKPATMLAGIKVRQFEPRVTVGAVANNELLARAKARLERLKYAKAKAIKRGDDRRVAEIEESMRRYRRQIEWSEGEVN